MVKTILFSVEKKETVDATGWMRARELIAEL
jgi:hypothetical protein